MATWELRRVECYPLSDALDDDARTVAAFASTLFACHLVRHFAGSRAFGTEILGSTWRSGFWIIIRGVRPKWI
jgi:hypothetical protein